jgi:hypothetical protein
MTAPRYTKMDDVTLRATYDMGMDTSDDWRAPRLSRIFNFEARQLITLYECGGVKDYRIPGGYSDRTGYSAAVTSSMDVKNFSALDDAQELARMHAKLKELGGDPPAIDDLTGQMGKKKPALRPPAG